MVFFFLIAVLFLPVPAFAQAARNDSISLSTYYPSPTGIYRDIQLSPGALPTEGVARGAMYFNATADALVFYNRTGWVQVSGSPLAASSGHPNDACAAAGGALMIANGTTLCRFNSASCPSGWTMFDGWSTTSFPTNSCAGCCGPCLLYSGTNAGHAWSNNLGIESYLAGPGWAVSQCTCTFTATRTQVGCY